MAQDNYFSDFNDFTLFLYIYMASADGSIDSTEVDVIKSKMPKLFPNVEVDEKFQRSRKEYESYSPDDIDKIIHLNFEKHKEKSFTSKYKIFSDLYEIIIADGIVDFQENQSIQKLKSIIEKNLDPEDQF